MAFGYVGATPLPAGHENVFRGEAETFEMLGSLDSVKESGSKGGLTAVAKDVSVQPAS